MSMDFVWRGDIAHVDLADADRIFGKQIEIVNEENETDGQKKKKHNTVWHGLYRQFGCRTIYAAVFGGGCGSD